jgi:raw score 5.62
LIKKGNIKMNNEQQSEQQKAIRRFFIGSFFIALLCAVIISEFVGDAFFLSFLISFIPGVMTTLIFFVTREKASRYYGRYLLVAFFMPFLIPIIVGLSLHFVDLNWDSTIDTIIGTYFLLGLPCTILGIVQLVLAVVCLPEMHK